MPDGRSKRLSSLFAFLRPRKAKGDKASIAGTDATSHVSADNVSSRSRTATPSPRPAPTTTVPAASLSPSSSTSVNVTSNTLAPPSTLGYNSSPSQPVGSGYDASRTVSSATFGSRMSGLNEVDVANFPLPPDHRHPPQAHRSSSSGSTSTATVKPAPAKVVVRSESTPVFSLGDDMPDLTLSNPARASQQSSRASFSPPKGREGFLRRASSVGLRLAGQGEVGKADKQPKSRPQSLLPPPQIPQIDLKFDVGRMDVDFNPAKPTSRSTTTL